MAQLTQDCVQCHHDCISGGCLIPSSWDHWRWVSPVRDKMQFPGHIFVWLLWPRSAGRPPFMDMSLSSFGTYKLLCTRSKQGSGWHGNWLVVAHRKTSCHAHELTVHAAVETGWVFPKFASLGDTAGSVCNGVQGEFVENRYLSLPKKPHQAPHAHNGRSMHKLWTFKSTVPSGWQNQNLLICY